MPGKKTPRRKLKILLVEDDVFLSRIFIEKLEHEGFVALHAANGALGLLYAHTKNPDLILLDILMPKIDGFRVLEEIKKDPSIAKIPVLMVTNLGQRGDVEKAKKLGAEDYLIKAHMKLADVIKRIRDILEK